MAQPLYPGCDVWLDNPLRPYEACGTSGMKAALNGGLNLSILDGWWDEWYDGNNGWAIPSADGIDDPERRDDLEATRSTPHRERRRAAVLRAQRRGRPAALARDGAPHPEVARPKVLATRQVRDYVRELYAPAAQHRALAQQRLRRRARAVVVEAGGPRRVAGRPCRAHRLRGRRRPGRGRRDARRPRLGGPWVAVGRRRRGPGRPRAHRLRRRADRHDRHADVGGESYDGNRHRFDAPVPLATSAPSATRSARSRATSPSPRSPSSGWWPSPPDGSLVIPG